MATSELRKERLAKLEALRAAGVDPYGSRVETSGTLADVRARCPEEPDAPAPRVTVAGRVVALRDMGKSRWMDLRDRSGKIQVNLLEKKVGEAFALSKHLDIGDFLAVTGDLMKSRTGEVTVFGDAFQVLAKSLEPLPAKWSGLRDTELRYRRRYLDLVANEASRERFILRSRIVRRLRRFLDERGFLEVETPMLQTQYGGAAARPFVTHHNALDLDLYLRISPETYLKRLLVGGLDRVYELNRNFRNEGIDTSHNPEFTMMEVYQAFADYTDMMNLTEELVVDAAKNVVGSLTVTMAGRVIDLTPPWPRKTIHELVREVAGVDPDDPEAMRAKLPSLGVPAAEAAKLDHDRLLMAVMDKAVEPTLVQPTFVTHHPASLNPLCKRNKDNPALSDRFEVLVAGFELANAFSELNDPLEQRARFEAQVAAGGDEKYCDAVDEDYVSALEVGLPPAGGMGMGIDRLVMLLTGQTGIREVVLFPTMKPRTPAEMAAAMEAEHDAETE